MGVLDERLRECAGSVITCFGRESQSQSERGILLGGKKSVARRARARLMRVWCNSRGILASLSEEDKSL